MSTGLLVAATQKAQGTARRLHRLPLLSAEHGMLTAMLCTLKVLHLAQPEWAMA